MATVVVVGELKVLRYCVMCDAFLLFMGLACKKIFERLKLLVTEEALHHLLQFAKNEVSATFPNAHVYNHAVALMLCLFTDGSTAPLTHMCFICR